MKGLLRAGGVALIVGVLLFPGRSSSEVEKPAVPRTRIGLVNLAYVVKNYKKVDLTIREKKDEVALFEQKLNKLKAEIESLNKELQAKDRTDGDRLDTLRKLQNLKFEMENRPKKTKDETEEKNEQQAAIVYKEIRKAAERYAKAHDLELVLHYLDGTTEAERDSPKEIMSKMQQRAAVPLYAAPGLDISKEIVAELNKGLADEKAPADSK